MVGGAIQPEVSHRDRKRSSARAMAGTAAVTSHSDEDDDGARSAIEATASRSRAACVVPNVRMLRHQSSKVRGSRPASGEDGATAHPCVTRPDPRAHLLPVRPGCSHTFTMAAEAASSCDAALRGRVHSWRTI